MAQLNEGLNIIQQIIELLPADLQVSQTTVHKVTKEQLDKDISYKGSRKLKINENDIYNQVENKAKELLEGKEQVLIDQINQLVKSLQPSYEIGDQFLTVREIQKIDRTDDEYKTSESVFTPSEGIVTLIDVWATWCGPCQGPMEKNQKLLENNPTWTGKVSIVALSVDDGSEEVIKRIQDKKWTSIEHYRFLKGWDNDNFTIKALGIRGIPFILLLDKQGKIVYKGHPSKGDIENSINKLIDGEFKPLQQDEEVAVKQEEYQLIAKEAFKHLKTKLAAAQVKVIEASVNGEISFSLTKSNLLGKNNHKETVERTSGKLVYSVGVEEQNKVEELANYFKEQFPELIVKAKILNPQVDKDNFIAKLLEVFQEQGVQIKNVKTNLSSLKFNHESNTFNLTNQEDSKLEAPKYPVEIFQKAEPILQDYAEKNIENEEDQEWAYKQCQDAKKGCLINVGDKFQTIQNYAKLDSQDFTTIEHKPDQILVVDYWAQWCGPCRSGLKKNHQLLKTTNWGDKVRIVALSLQKYPDAAEYITQNADLQENIEFYFPKEDRQVDVTLYGIKFIPHYVVVDKNGVLRACGSVDNLEELVNKLLEDKQDKPEEEVNVQITPEQFQAVVTYAQANQELLQNLGTQYTFQFKIEQLNHYDSASKTLIKSDIPTLSYYVRQSKAEQLNVFLNGLFAIAPKTLWKLNEEVQKTFDIPFPGVECVLCNTKLSDQVPQYYSPFKNEFVCIDCAEADDKAQQGLARYKYTDTLIFINAPLTDLSGLTGIEEYKKGKNLKIAAEEAGSQRHSMSCNGCSENAEGPRYIAISARPGKLRNGGYIDYCSACFAKLKNKDSDEAKKIIEGDKKEGVTENLLLLRVLFNIGYYDF